MKRSFLLIVCVLAFASFGFGQNGFDNLGYNNKARIFNGLADGTDGNLDGTIYGDSTYAKDRLVMKWTKAWDTCNDSGYTDCSSDAWLTNEWNGKTPFGSGETWHYKIQWVGPCGSDGDPLPDGGYCIWGSYEVTFSHGTVGNKHFWDAHTKPAGFGSR